MTKPLEKIIEDLGFLPGPAVSCTAGKVRTDVAYIAQGQIFHMRLADFIEIDRKLPEKVFFHGSNADIQKALQKDLEVYITKRTLRGISVANSVIVGGIVGALINPYICIPTFAITAPIAAMYCTTPSERELLTKHYLAMQK